MLRKCFVEFLRCYYSGMRRICPSGKGDQAAVRLLIAR
jgi:hypothetical protein